MNKGYYIFKVWQYFYIIFTHVIKIYIYHEKNGILTLKFFCKQKLYCVMWLCVYSNLKIYILIYRLKNKKSEIKVEALKQQIRQLQKLEKQTQKPQSAGCVDTGDRDVMQEVCVWESRIITEFIQSRSWKMKMFIQHSINPISGTKWLLYILKVGLTMQTTYYSETESRIWKDWQSTDFKSHKLKRAQGTDRIRENS